MGQTMTMTAQRPKRSLLAGVRKQGQSGPPIQDSLTADAGNLHRGRVCEWQTA